MATTSVKSSTARTGRSRKRRRPCSVSSSFPFHCQSWSNDGSGWFVISRRRLRDLVDKLPSSVQDRPNVLELADTLPAIRDDLSHGLQEHEPDELRPLIEAMTLVVDAHLLRLLGLEPSWATRLLD